MDIAEVSRSSGLPASTLRFYEEKGLIQSNGRNGLRRLFGANVIERLALISLARKAGFSLDEIGDMFTPDGPDIDRALLLAKADELDRKIRELTTMRDGLRHAAACRAPTAGVSKVDVPVLTEPIRTVRGRSLRSPAISRSRSTASRTSEMGSSSSRPAALTQEPERRRSSRETPSSRSSLLRASLTAGWETCRESAARRSEPCWTTARKYSSCSRRTGGLSRVGTG